MLNRRRYVHWDLFIFQKTQKNRILNIHTICNYSDHLFSVSYGYILSFLSDLTFPGYFLKLWRISYLFSTYYLSAENWPCNLWVEIFDKLRIYCCSDQAFVEEILVSYLWLFLAKIKTSVLKKITDVNRKVNVCYFWSFRVLIMVWPQFSPR